MFGHRGAICRVVNRSPRSPFALVSEPPPLFNSAGIRENQLVYVGFAEAERVKHFWGKATSYHAPERCVKKERVRKALSIKTHGLVRVHEHAMFQMRANSLCENCLLQVLSFANQVFDGMPVTYPHDVLGDNRTLIKRGRNIVRCRPDNLDAPSISLMVRSASREGRQKTVMNIDDRNCGVREKLSA